MDHISLKTTWHILLGTNCSHVHPSKAIYYYYHLLFINCQMSLSKCYKMILIVFLSKKFLGQGKNSTHTKYSRVHSVRGIGSPPALETFWKFHFGPRLKVFAHPCSRRYYTPSQLLTLYKAQIRPCLEYGSHL